MSNFSQALAVFPTHFLLDDWHSVNVPYTQTSSSVAAATKVLRFPGSYPDYSTDFLWMERHKIHGKPPESTLKVAIWGAVGEGSAIWSSLIAFSDHDIAKVYSSQLHSLINTGNEQILDELGNHWIQGCYYAHHLALNNACLQLAAVSRVLQDLVSIEHKNMVPYTHVDRGIETRQVLE